MNQFKIKHDPTLIPSMQKPDFNNPLFTPVRFVVTDPVSFEVKEEEFSYVGVLTVGRLLLHTRIHSDLIYDISQTHNRLLRIAGEAPQFGVLIQRGKTRFLCCAVFHNMWVAKQYNNRTKLVEVALIIDHITSL